MKKQYSAKVDYEKKLAAVMERVHAETYSFDWTRSGSVWIEFLLGGQVYRFEHSLRQAAETGQNLKFTSDCFAQLVLFIEDLARAAERKLFDFAEILGALPGVKRLPPPKPLAPSFKAMGFTEEPTAAQVKERYKALAKVLHPDAGGTDEGFARLTEDYEACMNYFTKEDRT